MAICQGFALLSGHYREATLGEWGLDFLGQSVLGRTHQEVEGAGGTIRSKEGQGIRQRVSRARSPQICQNRSGSSSFLLHPCQATPRPLTRTVAKTTSRISWLPTTGSFFKLHLGKCRVCFTFAARVVAKQPGLRALSSCAWSVAV